MSQRNFETGVYSNLNIDIEKLFTKGRNYTQIAKALTDNPEEWESLRKYVSAYIRHLLKSDQEVLEDNLRLSRTDQRSKDKLRIQRKSLRQENRNLNILEDLNKELISILRKEGLKFKLSPYKIKRTTPTLILHLTDLHANVEIDIPGNKYNFEVMSARLQKLADKIKKQGEALGTRKLFIAFGGDILSSDRRKEELLTLITSNSAACVIATQILIKFIADLAESFNIELGGVTGNEARISKDISWSGVAALENWDYTLYNMLDLYFEKNKRVNFSPFQPNESVFEVEGKNFLLIHGHQTKATLPQKDIQAIVGKYSSKGVKIFHTLLGHYHNTSIGCLYSRGSSLMGADAYSDEALAFSSRASQNLHIVYKEGLDSMKIDLQDSFSYKGYEIEEILNKYKVANIKFIHEEPKVEVYKTFK